MPETDNPELTYRLYLQQYLSTRVSSVLYCIIQIVTLYLTRQIEGLSQRPELLTQPAKKTDLTSRFFLFLPFLHLQQLNRRLNIYLILREDMRRTVEGGDRQFLQRTHLRAPLHCKPRMTGWLWIFSPAE